MQLSATTLSEVENSLRTLADIYPRVADEEQCVVTDLHLQPLSDSGELLLFDDDDRELVRTLVPEWENYAGDDFYAVAQEQLRQVLGKLNNEHFFDRLAIWRPYSVVMVDDEKETLVDLLLFDDDTLMLDDPLLKGFDEEMDSFLNHLLND